MCHFYFKDCPKECDYVMFKTSVNSAIYPTDYYAEMLLAQPKILARFNTQFTFVPYDYEGNETTDTAEEVSYTV
jgi:hypothetical protein